jgi:hypothetical protein
VINWIKCSTFFRILPNIIHRKSIKIVQIGLASLTFTPRLRPGVSKGTTLTRVHLQAALFAFVYPSYSPARDATLFALAGLRASGTDGSCAAPGFIISEKGTREINHTTMSCG